jgi:hypothetical protein
MTSLAQIIQSFSASEAFDTPPNWHQGRTIYGGLSAALALEAALQTAPPDLPPLKSAQILFVGPALNGLHFKAQTLRQGKSATMIAVDGMAEGQLILRVAFLFAHPRVSAVQHDLSCRPLVQPPEACISLHETGPTPIHLSNFEVRMAGPHLPVTGGDHPATQGCKWRRPGCGLAGLGRRPSARCHGVLQGVRSYQLHDLELGPGGACRIGRLVSAALHQSARA